METNIPVQPIPIDNQRNFLHIILAILMLLLLIAGVVYYLLNRRDVSVVTNPRVRQESTPIMTDEISQSVNPTSIIDQPTQTPISPSTTVTIPDDWKQFTATDPDFGVTTTMSLPPDYSFSFTGSEFTIANHSDATELWDYSSSIYRDNNEVLKNHYDGGSRRVWYQKHLSAKQSPDKIINIKEKPLNASSYLEIIVKTPSYDDHGVISGSKNGTHYIYVQNSILHMITPASHKAYTSAAQIPNNIESILASLSSVQIK